MAVEEYFKQGAHRQGSRVTCTSLPPIYFQHADESLKPYRRGAKYLRRYREFEILSRIAVTSTVHNSS
ncbi:hypothetical protein COL516b_003450 [Colletotrichum fioriniae]|nr:uncharacterized protein COL516b_003450 [Colletotrichum fioriniae]KAJ0308181.1 hypothetical protein COL516b_003450 [Colletotrichum fioriniae]